MKSRIFLTICTLAMALYVGLVKPEVFLAIKAPVSAEWQLAADQYVSRKMDMTVVYPRTQVSIDGGAKSGNTWARHLWAYPNIQYKIPIVIQGGAYPFKCELVSGPAGMTMGETYGSTASPTQNYCQIVWTAPASGTFPVSVKLYDQDYQRGGNPSVAITLDWDVQVTAAPFRFVSQGATGGDGLSPASPWGSIDAWFGSGATDNTAWAAGARIVYYMDDGGPINGWQNSGSPSNQNIALQSSGGTPYKPVVHLEYPGDSTIIDHYDGSSNGGYWVPNNVDDFFLGGLELNNVDPSDANAYQVYALGVSRNNHTYYEVEFNDVQSAGTAGNDNPNIVYYNASIEALYTAISHCSDDSNVIGFKFYNNRYAVVEHHTTSNFAPVTSNGSLWFQLKGYNKYTSIRDNIAITNNDTINYPFLQATAYGTTNENIEFAYNRFIINTKRECENNWGDKTMVPGSYGANHAFTSFWTYRNTNVGPVDNQGSNTHGCVGPVDWENGIVVNDNEPACNRILNGGGLCSNTPVGTLQGDWTSGDRIVDANGLLQNATTQWRDLYLGKKGAEIVAP